MNKRRNKSVTKTKHRVQKTKRNRRLNKNRSVKGIRGNNKTKVVGKRRNTVQRGGEVNDLVGRIFELDKLTEKERSDSVATIIHEITTDESPQDLFEVARGQDQSQDERVPNGPTVLYAACRLKNPSIELVNCILEKMKVRSTGISVKIVTGKPRSVATMYSIIPNGSSNRSYPQHAAVQAAKEILEGLSAQKYSQDIALTRIQMIIKILESLKTYDDNLAKHMMDGKNVMMRARKLTTADYTPLMNKKNHLSNGAEYTAYDEYVNGFGATPSLRDTLQKVFSVTGHQGHPNNGFERVLAPTGPVSVAAGSAGAVFHPPPNLNAFGHVPSASPPTWFSKIYGFHEMINANTSNVNKSMSLLQLTINGRLHTGLTCGLGLGNTGNFDAGIPLYKSTSVLLKEAESNVRLRSSPTPEREMITYREINADAKLLHSNPHLAGSLFQVASQFNTLEMASPEHTPEMGITIYEHDRTQGPICAMACPTGTLYRNYFMMPGGGPQTKTNQINTLETIINKFKTPEFPVNFVVKNGYILPATIADSNKLNTLLDNPRALEEMANDVKYVIQEDVPVILSSNSRSSHSVSQIYCSGFPLAYCVDTEYFSGLLNQEQQQVINENGGVKEYAYMNRNLIKMITTAMYTATLSHAVNMTITQQKRVKVFLTPVGTGVFGADETFVKGIMGDVIRKYRHFPIDLYLVNFAKDQDFPLALPPELNIDQVNRSLSDYPRPIPVSFAAPSPGAALPAASGLPAGWVEQFDTASSRPYYVNTATGHSVWVRPAIPSSVAAPGPVHVAAPSAGHAGGLPTGWKEMRSADGRIYFEDTRTGNKQWERPQPPTQPASFVGSAAPTKPLVPGGRNDQGWQNPDSVGYWTSKPTSTETGKFEPPRSSGPYSDYGHP